MCLIHVGIVRKAENRRGMKCWLKERRGGWVGAVAAISLENLGNVLKELGRKEGENLAKTVTR